MIDLTWLTLKTFISAFLWSLFGFLSTKPDEDFDQDKLLSTVVSAITVASLEVMWGIDPGTGETIVMYFIIKMGVIGAFDKIYKFLWRSYFKKWWDSIEKPPGG
jgi:hypothetical protein